MEWYIIQNIEDFVDSVRALVFNSFGTSENDTDIEKEMCSIKPSEQEECDQILSHQEAKKIVSEFIKIQINNKTKKKRYVLTEPIFLTMVEALNERMTSNLLNSLVNKGLIESAFDSDVNDFVFWIKDDNKTNTEKPETD